MERTRVRDDRRLVLVGLGPAGIGVLRELDDSKLDRVQRALAPLEPERLCGVLQAFSDFRAAIEADLGPHVHSLPAVAPADTSRQPEASPALPAVTAP